MTTGGRGRARLADRWFIPDEAGWHPRPYEWWFTRNPVQAAIRAHEAAGVLGAILAARASGGRALEIACGTGHFTRWLARSCDEVVAIDPSPPMLEYAEHRIEDEGLTCVSFRPGRLPDQLPDGRFDLVLAVGALNYIADLEESLRAIATGLRPGAAAIFTVPLSSPGGRAYALGELITRRRVRIYTAEAIRECAARAGLQVERTASVGLSARGFNLVVTASVP